MARRIDYWMCSRWISSRLVASLFVCALCLCALAAHGQAQYRDRFPLPNGTVPDMLGVNIHFNDPKPGEMEQLAAAGFRWIRQDFTWEAIEREKGQYDFAAYDRLMAHLKPFGIRPIFILDYGNALYQQGAPRTPEARAAFGRFAAAAVTHFKGQGVVWEMWNEPNGTFWAPKANVDEYIALAEETGKAIRSVSAEEWYVGPGMSGMDFPFLQRCLQAGLLKYWDAVSFHPYRDTPPETAAADFEHVRELIEQAAPHGKQVPILSSEWGYSELYPGLDRERQSWYIARQTLSNLVNGLRISIWYDWHDDGTDAKEAEHHFGTIFNDYREKETYHAIQTLSKTLNGFKYNKRLVLATEMPALDHSEVNYCLLFVRGDEERLVAWTTSRSPRTVLLPTSAGKFQFVSYLGVSSEGTATDKGLPLTLTEAPVYIIPRKNDPLLALAAAWSTLPPYVRFGDQKSIDTLLDLSVIVSEKPGQLMLTPWMTETGERIRMPLTKSKVVRVPPGLQTIVDRSATPHRYWAILSVKGQRPLVQATRIVARDPLGVKVLPPMDKVLTIQVTNSSGKPLNAWLHLIANGKGTRFPVVFKEGEISGRFDLPLAQPLAPDAELRVDLGQGRETSPNPLVTAPGIRFQNLLPSAPSALASTLSEQSVKIFPDGDPKIESHLDLTQGAAPEGLPVSDLKAAKITYDFSPGWKFLCVKPEGKLQEPLKGEPDTLGMWVYSDGSKNLLRARFIDATGQTFQPDGGDLSGKGWRYVTFPLHPGGGHWGGANDDKVHYPIRLDTLLLIDTPDQKGARGEIYFTDVNLSYVLPR